MDLYGSVPLAALRPSTQKLLSSMLNPSKIIPTDTGLARDWRGLAELGGFSSEHISNLETTADPTESLLKELIRTKQTQVKFFSDLRAFLAVIDRYDVVEDANYLLEKDAVLYSSTVKDSIESNNSAVALDANFESKILTIEDSVSLQKGLPLPHYDAFILYSEEDSIFANQVVEKMEKEYNLKMCVKDRDLLPGVMFEHEIIGRIIEERCNRLLVIFSPNFIKSTANQFLVSYAHAIALDRRVRKIIPCMYQRCELPPSVRYSFCLDYNRSTTQWNFFWDKLSQSLRTTIPTKERKTSAPASMKEMSQVNPTKYGASLPDSLSWWDAQKNSSASLHSSTSDSGILKDIHESDDLDRMSIASDAYLLSNGRSSLGDKEAKGGWFKKITTPIKKMRDKGKKSAIAE